MVRRRALFVHTAGPDVALIKSGGRRKKDIIISGRMFSVPIFQRVDALNLDLRTIVVHTTRGLTVNGVSVDVTSTCQVKIMGWGIPSEMQDTHQNAGKLGPEMSIDYTAIRLAAQHFLGKSNEEIEQAIQKTIAGHQRAIIGALTVEELYRNRAAFCKRVLDLCSVDVRNMGLFIVSYVVAEISDENGYIDALGVTQTELVKREAAEGKAVHQAQARVRTAEEEAGAHRHVNSQAEIKIESDKQRNLTQTRAQEEVLRRQAIKDKASHISEAEQNAILYVKQQEARAAETKAELEVMRQQVERERLVKEKKVNVEADALLYHAKVNAEAVRKSAEAEAEKTRMLGQAHADATRAKGMAEIDVLRERNKIWQRTGNYGAIMERMIGILPQVAEAVAKPLEKTEKMVFVSTGEGKGGASLFTADMKRAMAEVPEVVQALTGFSMNDAMGKVMSGRSGDAIVQGVAEGAATAVVDATLNRGTRRVSQP